MPSTDPDHTPASPDPGSRRRLARWLPVGIVAVLVVAGVAVSALGGGGGEEEEAAPTGTRPDGAITWTQAQEEGLDVTFPDTCDEETGRVALPFYFAPECYANVEDNGGETATGVTADSIKVIVYRGPEDDPVLDYVAGAAETDDTPEQTEQSLRDFVEIFQAYYQTYGRTVEIEYFEATGTSEDEVAARADAAEVASRQPFAVLGGPVLAADAWATELAANEVICICAGGPTTGWYEDNAPYVYTLGMNPEQGQQHGIEYLGQRIVGRDAEWAGDESMHDQERVFGLLYLETGEESADLVSTFEEGLAEYDAELAVAVPYTLDPARLQEQAVTAIAKLKGEGVTSVIFAGDPLAPATLTAEATAQDYFPEWMFGNVVLVDTAVFARTYDQEQWAHASGVTQSAVGLDPSMTSWYYLHEWYFGEPVPAEGAASATFIGPSLLFYGIHAAGPNLTPENFRDGMFELAPDDTVTTQPYISFGDHDLWPGTDYNGTDDLAEIWWDPGAEGPDEIGRQGKGLYRFVDGGQRYLPGNWPDSPPAMFEREGSVTRLDEPPEDEAVPDYPPPERDR
jgi:hypothetical protein